VLRHRKIVLAVSVLVVVGSISSAVGYAVYIRGDAYRHSVERMVGDYLHLETQIDQVTPLSSSSRLFSGIRIFLPELDEPTFQCGRAVWRIDQQGEKNRVALELGDGSLTLDSRDLNRDSYRTMLSSGFGHDFAALGLASVKLDVFDIVWKSNEISMVIQKASGDVAFGPDGNGRANLTARQLNGTQLNAPLLVNALFTPGESLRFHHVSLGVPHVPLNVLGLGRVLGGDVSAGWFDGSIILRDKDGHQNMTLRGALGDVRLEELTASVFDKPIRGRVDIMLDDASVSGGQLDGLTFRGSLSDVRLEDLAEIANVPGLTGLVNLQVQQARIVGNQIAHASATGDAVDVPLEAITKLIGRGVVTGKLRITIHGVLIEDHKVKWADISIDAVNPPDKPGTISRDVILTVAKDVLGIELGRISAILPETIEYTELGLRILVEGGTLRFKGSHGTDGNSVLTIRDPILGRPMSVFSAPDRTFKLDDLLERVRERLEKYDIEDLREWWESNRRPSDVR